MKHDNTKPNYSKHKKELFGQSDMKVVAEAIGDLHYETLSALFFELSEKIDSDGRKDFINGRIKLSEKLFNAKLHLHWTGIYFQDAWEISKPFMTNDNTQTK